jgi:hypothetical protein
MDVLVPAVADGAQVRAGEHRPGGRIQNVPGVIAVVPAPHRVRPEEPHSLPVERESASRPNVAHLLLERAERVPPPHHAGATAYSCGAAATGK